MVNRVTLLGNVGKDPEIKMIGETGKTARFSLATEKKFKKQDGTLQTETSWHNIQVWNRLADVVEKFVKKGDKLYLEGSLKYESWEDNNGEKKYMTVINASQLQMLGGKKAEPAKNEANDVDEDGGLPF